MTVRSAINGRMVTWHGRRPTEPSFSVERVDDELKIVRIIDNSDRVGHRSVTNAAELVVEVLNRDYPGYRIVYLDTMGNWDELRHDNGTFLGYKPCKNRETGEI